MKVAFRTAPRIFRPVVRTSTHTSSTREERTEGRQRLKVEKIFAIFRPEERISKQIVIAESFADNREVSNHNPIAVALASLPKPYDEQTLERIKAMHPEADLNDIAILAARRQDFINILARNAVLPSHLDESAPVIEIAVPSAPADNSSVQTLKRAIRLELLLPEGLTKTHEELSDLVRASKTLTADELTQFTKTEEPIITRWLNNLGIVL